VAIGGTVSLTGTAHELIITSQCKMTKKPAAHSWALFFKPAGGTEGDVTGQLVNPGSLTPHFVAAGFGIFRAVLTVGPVQGDFDTAQLVTTVFRPMVEQQATGKVTLLRVNEIGEGFGPPGDAIEAEVIVELDTQSGMAFGFQLRNDKERPVHQGMLDLLRDALANNFDVTIDLDIPQGNKNGTIIRLALTK
jgi:hypothetical protein